MSLFSSGVITTAALLKDRALRDAAACGLGSAFSASYLESKLKAAEKAIERSLRLSLSPVELLPDGGTAEERAAFDGADPPVPWKREPAYDMTRKFFHGDSWGLIELRERPLIEVHSIRFVYPEPFDTIWEVPSDWIRFDPKYSHVRLVPGSSAFVPPVFSWTMQTVTGGRSIPHMIHVRYRAGIEDPNEYPDLVDVVYGSAALGIIDDQFLPQSGSTSVDGISQSRSFDATKHQDRLNYKIDLLRKNLYGLVFGAL